MANGTSEQLPVALFVWRFPAPSETFVLRHAVALLAAGIDFRIITRKARGNWTGVPPAIRSQLEPRIERVAGSMRAAPISVGRIMLRLSLAGMFDPRARRRRRAIRDARRAGQNAVARDIAAIPLGAEPRRFGAILAHFGPTGVRAMYMRQAGVIVGPILTVFHGFDLSVHEILAENRRGYQRLFRTTELMLPVSELWAERLRRAGAPAHRVRVLRMGIDIPPHDNGDIGERPLGVPLRALVVGRFTEKKGIGFAIEGVRRCSIPVLLSVIGFGELEEELKVSAATPGINRVEFLGQLPHAAVLEQMKRSDVFIQASVTAANGDMEGVPVALMEAMARGCLVVATRHSGIPELVEHGKSGLLVEERSPGAIATAIERIASGDIDIIEMRRAAYAAVLARFDGDKLDGDMVTIMREARSIGMDSRR